MCGIFAILFSQEETLKQLKAKTASASHRITHRGPDWSGQYVFQHPPTQPKYSFAIAHERLQIIDPYGGEQPIFDKEKQTILAVNGEIYNYQDLIQKLQCQDQLTTGSDCEVIIHLYKKNPEPVQLNQQLSGVFSYILYDDTTQTFLVSRDAIGVNPLYIGYRESDGGIFLSSEIKAFQSPDLQITDFEEFPPGHYLKLTQPHSIAQAHSIAQSDSPNFNFQAWYTPKWKSYEMDFIHTANQQYLLAQIRTGLTESVRSRLMSDAPFGFLLSGGLDSSLVCSIATRLLKLQSFRNKPVPVINTFSIGQQDSPDLKAAQKVADFLGTKHHNFTFTVDQGMASVPQAIYHMETFDVTTIRAGTPMYLLSRRIKAMGTKMVLSGEGADELFGGYLYFHQAPNPEEFYHETVDKVNQLSQYDCRRANKSTAAWGVEVRVPFLDRDFVNFIMSLPPELKMITPQSKSTPDSHQSMEKWILRKAFEGYLPDEILWRQKEQFSDGVGYSWIDGLKAQADETISDQQLSEAPNRFPQKTPLTKEAYYYRQIFQQRLPHLQSANIVPWSKSVACSTERALRWQKEWAEMDEPSGRACQVHTDRYTSLVHKV